MGGMSRNMVIGLALAALGILAGVLGLTMLPEGMTWVGGVAGAACIGIAVLYIQRGIKDAKAAEDARFKPKDIKGVSGESSAAKPGRGGGGPIDLD
jgi:hypothetical protein